MRRRKPEPYRDSSGRFAKRPVPYRDSSGRFAKRPVPYRDSSGRFAKRPKRKVQRPAKPTKAATVKRAKKFLRERETKFDLCHASERERFYKQVLEERRKLQKKLSDEDFSALRVTVDVIGKPPKKKTKSGKLSKRKTTAFIGKRTFADLRHFRRFLLLETGYGGKSREHPFRPDWRKKAMCQYRKEATLEIRRERGRRKPRVLKKFQIGS